MYAGVEGPTKLKARQRENLLTLNWFGVSSACINRQPFLSGGSSCPRTLYMSRGLYWLAMSRYESFLVKHVSAISTVESSLRSLTWFLPGRFKDAELASEACKLKLTVHLQFSFQSSIRFFECAEHVSRRSSRKIRAFRPEVPPFNTFFSSHTLYNCLVRKGPSLQMGGSRSATPSLHRACPRDGPSAESI